MGGCLVNVTAHIIYFNYGQVGPPKSPWVGVGQKKIKVRVSIRTCVANLGAVRREICLTMDNPLNPHGVGWLKMFIFLM